MAFKITKENSIQVEIGDHGYPIVFEPLSSLGASLSACIESGDSCVLVSNDVVGPLYAEKAIASLSEAGWKTSYLEIKDGEAAKSIEAYVDLVQRILALEVTRQTPLIALGGGVVTDIVGFAAATVNRGLPFANVPTSLLAMVDASVGGKTGVNTPAGKNKLGCFWQPKLVHVAIETLQTLTDPEYNCGMGEIVKHGILDEIETSPGVFEPSTALFEWLEENAELLRKRDFDALKYAVWRNVEIKAQVVKVDPFELGKRSTLNLGHTIGHAVEFVAGYGKLRHGEAVGIGTIAETQLSVLRGKCKDKELPKRIAKLLKLLNLPVSYPGLSADALVESMASDKKRYGKIIKVSQPVAIGQVELHDLTLEEIKPALVYLDQNANL